MKQLTISPRLTNRDTESFNLYLKDIYEIEVLTPAEEIILGEKASNGDKDAKTELVRRNLRFVVSVAKQYATSTNLVNDLVNEGNIGVIIAAEKYEASMGYRFISYAVWWIQKLILEHLAKNGRMVRLPANKINNLSKLDKRINALEQKLGRSVDIQEIIEIIQAEIGDSKNAKKKVAKEMELLSALTTYGCDSLDREIGGEDGNHTTLGDLIADDSTIKPTDQLVIDANIKSEVTRIINSLKPREKRIMIALFGLDGKSPMTLQEVGDEIGVTREMIRQIKEKVLKNLKQKLVNSSIRECS